MTEDEARRVLLVQAHEPALLPGAARGDEALQRLWSPEDRAWATRQALAAVGEKAAPEAFVVARAGAALQRLLPRAPQAQRWLDRRVWHPAWVVLAVVVGFISGLVVDQLGPPQRVNLLAPAVWAVVAWNVAVYAALHAAHARPRAAQLARPLGQPLRANTLRCCGRARRRR
jgi:hypothetical protein